MTSYDVIVVGARVAGAATAMLLARRGVKVLLIDRTRFPSDTLSLLPSGAGPRHRPAAPLGPARRAGQGWHSADPRGAVRHRRADAARALPRLAGRRHALQPAAHGA